MPDSQHRKRIWWLGGLVLVLSLLAHDVLMASVAHAAPLAPAASTAHGHDPAHPAGASKAIPPAHDPSPEHPSDCSTTKTAAPFSKYQLDFSNLGHLALFVGADPFVLAHAAAHNWSEPLWPPGTRRALLQVYRI